MVKITIYGQPITKKNSQMIIMAGKRPCIIQSKAYRQYEKNAKEQMAFLSSLPTIEGPVQMTCLYYLATARDPDLLNLLAATSDLMEYVGVVLNDKQIKSVDGSRIMGKDPEPRVEITLEEF